MQYQEIIPLLQPNSSMEFAPFAHEKALLLEVVRVARSKKPNDQPKESQDGTENFDDQDFDEPA